MKKQFTLIALALGMSAGYAQDLTSKKGEQILPEAGDWGIGIEANPFLEYFGNFFGKSANNTAPNFNFLNSNQTITGKYFQDAQTAFRASLRIGFGTVTDREMVEDRFKRDVNQNAPPVPNTYPTANAMVENSWKRSTTNIGLAAGIEKRKGKTRLQGYYGGELGINFSSSKDKFEYGNKLKPESADPNTDPQVLADNADSFSGANNVFTVPTANSPLGRVTERKNGTVFSFGVRGFIGVEYFILPKISLGGEFGWGIGLRSQGKSTTKMESVGNQGVAPEDQKGNTTIETAKDGSFTIDTDNVNSIFGPAASLRLNFHF